MIAIRCIYREVEPKFPASDNHPDAVRYPMIVAGEQIFVDAVGGEPTIAEVQAVLNPPPPPEPTPAEKLAAAGLTVQDLRVLLDLP